MDIRKKITKMLVADMKGQVDNLSVSIIQSD